MNTLPIRAKLTLWYLLATFAGMLLFGIISYGVLHYALLQEKKTHLLGREDRLLRLIDENRTQQGSASLEELLSKYALVTHEGNMFQLRKPDGSLLFPSGETDIDLAFATSSGCGERRFHIMQFNSAPAMVM
jgi:hypothetical protein